MNLLILKNYTITDHTKWYNDRSSETDLVENYREMEKVCTKSAENNIDDLDDIIVHRGQADNIRDVFKEHFHTIYDVWKQGNNVLYCDLDVVFTKPVNYFNNFEYFSMFNLTDPMKTHDAHYDVTFEHYFNCGIRYYPQDMDEKIWNLGFSMLENWNPDRWDSEQIIYNAMLWSQNIEANEVYYPQYAYQLLSEPLDNPINIKFNQISLDEAYAVHVHGSRGSGNRLALMQELVNSNT